MGAHSSAKYSVKAKLDVHQAVPGPQGASLAKGTLTGRLTLAGTKSELVWQLHYSKLSGRATAAKVGVGARGRRGSIALTLCTKCVSGVRGVYSGPALTSKKFVRALLHGRT
jgi:hypothetical protein